MPPELSARNQVLGLVQEAEREAAKRKDATGVKFGKMSAEMAAAKEETFSYAKLLDKKFEVWANLQEFYGISSDFPSEYLFFQKETNNNLVLIS